MVGADCTQSLLRLYKLPPFVVPGSARFECRSRPGIGYAKARKRRANPLLSLRRCLNPQRTHQNKDLFGNE